MNKSEANVLLIIITLFASLQYAFLGSVPEEFSSFAFLTVTNAIGLVIMLIFTLPIIRSEFYRITGKQILQGLVLSAELFGFNIFMLIGTAGASATMSSCVLSMYFIFIPPISLFVFKQKVSKECLIGITAVFIGLIFMMNGDLNGLLDVHILALIIADIFFAFYIITVGRFSIDSNPMVLSIGQLLFNTVFAFAGWSAETLITGNRMFIPNDSAFWGSVIYMSFFIRVFYGIVQIYAQRFVTPLNASLIFSTEIVMTMLMSPILSILFGTRPEEFTTLKIIGAIIIVAGVLLSDSDIFTKLISIFRKKKREEAVS